MLQIESAPDRKPQGGQKTAECSAIDFFPRPNRRGDFLEDVPRRLNVFWILGLRTTDAEFFRVGQSQPVTAQKTDNHVYMSGIFTPLGDNDLPHPILI
ncbi:MAG: hypothetical protein LBO82_07470 [Synergistaceae bacterium]|nr:hypothetical protein [Synergistaceae bacterium]